MVNVVFKSSFVKLSFFCIKAAANPISEKYVRKAITAETIKKTPKMAGARKIVRSKLAEKFTS